jgi:hypothetical protein
VSADVRILVARRPEIVFDYFADLRNEPQYNRQVRGIKKTSPGPITRGSTFEGIHRGFGRVTWRLSEYERPTLIVIEGRIGSGLYRWVCTFAAISEGTCMVGRMEWQPLRSWRIFHLLLAAILGWNARRTFRRMAEVLEANDVSSASP